MSRTAGKCTSTISTRPSPPSAASTTPDSPTVTRAATSASPMSPAPWPRVSWPDRLASGPVTQRLDVGGGAVAQPAVELGLVFELLPAEARHDDKPAIHFRQGRHV